ncbi:unnamed protein product, partial [Didymodactylos carnosus]
MLFLYALFLFTWFHHSTELPIHRSKRSFTNYWGATATPVERAKSLDELPRDWDWCNVNGKSFCTASWNQHIPKYCGSCYLHGTLAALNDRLKIQFNGLQDILLGRQVFLNCGKARGLGNGCYGGKAYQVLEYMYRYGLPDETCQNYVAESSPTCNDETICQNCLPVENGTLRCWPVKNPILFFVQSYGQLSGEIQMMSEIYKRGPISCGFYSTLDFDYNYKYGVYTASTGINNTLTSKDLNHVVEGSYWGENGFFRIIRGINHLLFESSCVFGLMNADNLGQ